MVIHNIKKIIMSIIWNIYFKLAFINKLFLSNLIIFGKSPEILLHGKNSKLIFKGRTNFRNYLFINVGKNAKLTIGKNTFFNNYLSINCHEEIVIGDNCIFGENVKLYDHEFRKKGLIKEQGFITNPIKIGSNVWIGSNVTILKGVTIDDNSVIAAGSIVTKNVPENSCYKNFNSNFINKYEVEE
ncbi:MAG: acyltransferase [Culicoidibacterales bacterium]